MFKTPIKQQAAVLMTSTKTQTWQEIYLQKKKKEEKRKKKDRKKVDSLPSSVWSAVLHAKKTVALATRNPLAAGLQWQLKRKISETLPHVALKRFVHAGRKVRTCMPVQNPQYEHTFGPQFWSWGASRGLRSWRFCFLGGWTHYGLQRKKISG